MDEETSILGEMIEMMQLVHSICEKARNWRERKRTERTVQIQPIKNDIGPNIRLIIEAFKREQGSRQRVIRQREEAERKEGDRLKTEARLKAQGLQRRQDIMRARREMAEDIEILRQGAKDASFPEAIWSTTLARPTPQDQGRGLDARMEGDLGAADETTVFWDENRVSKLLEMLYAFQNEPGEFDLLQLPRWP
jgi:hypothetical protein